MNLDEIRELIRLMKENGLGELEIESQGEHVRLKAAAPEACPPPPAPIRLPLAPGMPHAEAADRALASPSQAPPAPPTGLIIKSPIVGTFYRATAPDKAPFVEVGDAIDETTVLCIIEAMKVMNEIKAEARGRIVQILVETNQPVEFGQPLFVIEPQE